MPATGNSRRAWGWHPLSDQWAVRVVAAAGIRAGQLVLDIGAGTGALTAPLVGSGARVIAVEPHQRRAQYLHDRFTGTVVTVVAADALTLPLPHRSFRVVANPPFSMSTALLRLLLSPHSRLVAADLVLQRALVRRLVHEGHAGRRWVLREGLALTPTGFPARAPRRRVRARHPAPVNRPGQATAPCRWPTGCDHRQVMSIWCSKVT